MTNPSRDAVATAGALLDTLERQRRELIQAGDEAVRRHAVELDEAVRGLATAGGVSALPRELVMRIREGLDLHARLVSTAARRVGRGLHALGLDEAGLRDSRSRFARSGPARASTHLSA